MRYRKLGSTGLDVSRMALGCICKTLYVHGELSLTNEDIARLEKPSFQEALAAFVAKNGHANWMVQAALTREAPGFVPDLKSISQQLARVSSEMRRSVATLARLGNKAGPSRHCAA